MNPRLLVVTSVHPPDDPRIRERLIRTLASDFDVAYATKEPGPSSDDGIDWIQLVGNRRSRRRAASHLLRSDPYDIAVVHDPELLPGAVRAVKGGRRVVFDLHENLPAQLASRSSIPVLLRPIASSLAGRYLRSVEKHVAITLAEESYADLFAGPHPIFPNYPRYDGFPDAAYDASGPIVYVGDVKRPRGVLTVMEAAARLGDGRTVEFVGRCEDDLRWELLTIADRSGVAAVIHGWLPHEEAMRIAAGAAVGVSPLHDLPNYTNSLPTKTLEYLAAGTPVVASDLPGTREVIGDLPATSLVAPGSVDALTDGLRSVLADPTIGDQALRAAEIVRERYAWPEDAAREFYYSLLP